MSFSINGVDSHSGGDIRSMSYRHAYKCDDLEDVPQQVQDCPPRVEISIFEEAYYYTATSVLPGVKFDDLWVHIEEKTSTLYVGIKEKERKGNCMYRYPDNMPGEIKGEIVLPEQAFYSPEIIEFNGGVLLLIFPKATEEFFARRAFDSLHPMRLSF